MKILRLITTYKCHRHCDGCCNNQEAFLPKNVKYVSYKYELDTFIAIEGFNEVILTGGEPLLDVLELVDLIKLIRESSDAKIYVYTTLAIPELMDIIKLTDGITFTLHSDTTNDEYKAFRALETTLKNSPIYLLGKSMRLNIFYPFTVAEPASFWKVKPHIKWINPCPLPTNEIIRRLTL